MRVITLDMDGTLYDPWACCGVRGDYRSASNCTHLRADTWARVRVLAASFDARLVVLSWRGGLERLTRAWLDEVGIPVEFVFVPDGADDISDPYLDFCDEHYKGYKPQVAFKVATMLSLAELGVEVVGAFEDSDDVLRAYEGLGIPTHRVEHKVRPLPHEKIAGFLGAPEDGADTFGFENEEALVDFRRSFWRDEPLGEPDYGQRRSIHSLTDDEWQSLESSWAE